MVTDNDSSTTGFLGKSRKGRLWGWLPLILFGLGYELWGWIPRKWWGRIRIRELYDLEKAIFGFIPPHFFDVHTHVIADLVGAFFYSLHFWTFLAFSLYLSFRERRLFVEFGWNFFVLNLLWMIFCLAFPSAPPWYGQKMGFDPPNFPIFSDPAGLARVDRLLGISLFANVYHQSRIVFGAFPSMHAAWPILMILVARGLRKPWLMALLVVYAVGMWTSAVYLNHHYAIDLIAGGAMAVAVYFVTTILWKQ